MRLRFALLVMLAMLPLATAGAQNTGPQNVLSVQPLTVILKSIDVTAYSGEYERAIAKKFSLGIGATYWDGRLADDSATYTSADLKVRYYPWTGALRGLSIGGSGGFSKVRTVTTTFGEQTFGGPSIGGLAEYQLMLGSFAVAVGGGVKNVQVSNKRISEKHHLSAPYPTARFSIGYAF